MGRLTGFGRGEKGFGFFSCGKAFIYGTGEMVHLCPAGFPILKDSSHAAFSNPIKFHSRVSCGKFRGKSVSTNSF